MSNESEKGNGKTEVLAERPRRRRFTAEFKLRVLELADRCSEPGEVGALLRREGLYSSHLWEWRRARRDGQVSALAPKKRGPAVNRRDHRDERIAELEADVQRLQRRAERAEGLVELQKKVAELLGELPNRNGKP